MNYDYLKNKRILFVDDEEGLRQMVCSILKKEGYRQVESAGTMAQALELCASWKPEFAILDVMSAGWGWIYPV